MKLGLRGVSKGAIALMTAGVLAVPMAHASVKSSQIDDDRVVITYQIEDINTLEGRAVLEREIRSAAATICGTVNYAKVRSLKAVSKSRSCYNEAVSTALSELDSGALQITAR